MAEQKEQVCPLSKERFIWGSWAERRGMETHDTLVALQPQPGSFEDG